MIVIDILEPLADSQGADILLVTHMHPGYAEHGAVSTKTIGALAVTAVRAYNRPAPFHPTFRDWFGSLVEVDVALPMPYGKVPLTGEAGRHFAEVRTGTSVWVERP